MDILPVTLICEQEPTAMSSIATFKAILDTYPSIKTNVIIFPIAGMTAGKFRDIENKGMVYDNVISINYRRIDYGGAFNKKTVFVTWLQDEIDWIYNSNLATIWNDLPDDWIIGYTDQVSQFGYRNDRLIEMPFLVNPDNYSNNNEDVKTTDIVFAGNKGYVLEDYAIAAMSKFCQINKISFPLIIDFISKIREYYNQGLKICGYDALRAFLIYQCPELSDILSTLSTEPKNKLLKIYLYWGINEAMYRQVVLKWITQSGLLLNIAGYNWSKNPEFCNYCHGYIENKNLPVFYRSGKYALHLNSFEGFHHRPSEILMSGVNMLMRKTYNPNRTIVAFNKEQYINTQINLIDYILTKIFNKDKNVLRPNTDMLYSTPDSAITFDSKEDLISLI